MPPTARYVIGMMTGTSLDGLDAALLDVRGRDLNIAARFVRHVSRPLGLCRDGLQRLSGGEAMTAREITALARRFGELHVDAVRELLSPHVKPTLIVAHGQTVFHQPPESWQLFNPAPLAAATGCPVFYDLRQGDLIAGGEGAPITPLADWVLLRHPERTRAVVNLGGFCNVTILPAAGKEGSEAAMSDLIGRIAGFDLCACNLLLDAVARRVLASPYDADGAAAKRGTPDQTALESLRNALSAQRDAGRSLGSGDELTTWIDRHAARVRGDDLAATAVTAVATCLAESLVAFAPDEVVLAGGGAKNVALRKAIEVAINAPLVLSDSVGLPIEAREAAAMAVLGAVAADGSPITLEAVTGRREQVAISGCCCLPRAMSPQHVRCS